MTESHAPGHECRVAFEHLPSGVLLAERGGAIKGMNRAARRLLGPVATDSATTCCEVFGCHREETVLARTCITALALDATAPLPEIRVDLALSGAGVPSVWVIAAPVEQMPGRAVLELRPGASSDRRRRTEPHWLGQTRLRVTTLGRTRVDSEDGPRDGEWLSRRPGEVLKFLVCNRGRPVPTEELLETFWPLARGGGAANLRQTIHVIRHHLEPRRSSRQPSSSRRAQGRLRAEPPDGVDRRGQPEHCVDVGLRAMQRGEHAAAEQALSRAATLRRGDFLADEPYADWRSASGTACVTSRPGCCGRCPRCVSRAATSMVRCRRLASSRTLQPLDLETQRDMLRLLLMRGQYSEASRRLDVVRRHWRRTFGEEPDLDLGELKRPSVRSVPRMRQVAGGR